MAKQTGTAAYYSALQRVFELQAKILTEVLPHAGKQGSNHEERCRTFLKSVLPRRYGISSGFIVSSIEGTVPSPEQDIVIFDDFLNSPLYREPAAGVFPAEMVYATVEVKATLNSKGIDSTLKSIGAVRSLAQQCWYEFPRTDSLPGRWRLEKNEMKRPGRAFIFAFDTTYKSPEALKTALEEKLNKPENKAHLHGIVVVSKGWFAFQQARKRGDSAVIQVFGDNGLLRFVNNMLKTLKGVVIREAEMGRYLKIPTIEVVEGETDDEAPRQP